MIRFWKKVSRPLIFSVLIIAGSSATATALQSSSAHYGVDQTVFSSGSVICDPGNNGSANYCASQTLGDTGVGNSASANYQIQAGSLDTDRQESLTLVVGTSNIDVGVLTDNATKTAEASFSVLSYLASGYAVYTSSPGPQNGSYTMHTLSSPASSTTGSEQFGINVVANSCPANTPPAGLGSCSGGLGANPNQIPDSTFSFGHASTNYDQANLFTYNNGDQIAQSDKSSGQTNYTISYLFNISPITPGGTYTMQQSIVVASTF